MKIKISEGIFSKVSTDSVILLSMHDENFYYRIEGQFIKLWPLIEGNKTREEILKEFSGVLKVSEKMIFDEVNSFLDDLIEFELVTEA